MDIRSYLKEKPLIFDGAMGTYIAQRYNFDLSQGCEQMNEKHPDWVERVHLEYLKAGACAIKTNTFLLSGEELVEEKESQRERICHGWNIASEAVRKYQMQYPDHKDIYIFADLGPIGINDHFKVEEAYQKAVDIFLGCGAKHFIFETLDDTEGIFEIAEYIKKQCPEAFIIASFGVSPEGFTRGGCFGRRVFRYLQESEAIDAIGFNCISGPKHLLDMLQSLEISDCNKYISIMPNSGYPTMISNRKIFDESYKYFAKIMHEIAQKGVAILGGCCGTNPACIRALNEIIIEEPVPVRQPRLEKVTGQTEFHSGAELAENNLKNTFMTKLNQGKKVIVVELDPPVTPDVDTFMEGAARYKKIGVDAIDIADCPIARARIDSSILASKVSRELHMTAIPHMTCRDRNINATKALLLGLNIEGVNNVLTVTGDPVPAAEREEIKTVFSYNSAVLSKNINTFNETMFANNPFLVCGALNINAVNFDAQLVHAQRKVQNGVRVLFTQPVMTKQGLENLIRAKKELNCKILGGLIPVVSYKNACFMHNEIAGIQVDEKIIEMYKGKNREEGELLAEKIVLEIASQIKDIVDGYYLITPFQRINLMEKIIRGIKKIEN